MSEESDQKTRGGARIGTTIKGKYRIDRLLGEGGMALVYEATHRNNKRFAVKMLHAELSHEEEIRSRFLKEGYLANTVDHPGAVAIMDDDVAEDGAAFLVMELLDGSPVDELYKRLNRKLPVRATLVIAHELLDVLTSAHAKGIVHRDLKPANLFVTKDGTLKVLDFGIGRIRDAAQANPHVTATGMMLGTPPYMPPEQAMAKSSEMDGRTDLWAVGATMFTLMSGHFVHHGDNPSQMLIATATQDARSLASVAPSVPAPVVAIVDRALRFEKADRWQSAAEMRAAIADAYRAQYGNAIGRDVLADLVRMSPLSTSVSVDATMPLQSSPYQGLGREQRADTTSAPVSIGSQPGPGAVPPAAGSQPSSLAAQPGSLGAQRAALGPSTGAAKSALETATTQSSPPAAPAARTAPPEGTKGSSGRSPLILGGVVVAALAVGGAIAFGYSSGHGNPTSEHPTTSASTHAAPPPSEAPVLSVAPPTPSPAPVPAPTVAMLAPGEVSVFVPVEPANVTVEIDGRPVPVADGGIMLQGMLGVSHPVRILQEGQETKGEVAITKVGSRVGPVPTALKADPLKPRPKGAPRDAGAKQVNPALDGKFEQ